VNALEEQREKGWSRAGKTSIVAAGMISERLAAGSRVATTTISLWLEVCTKTIAQHSTGA